MGHSSIQVTVDIYGHLIPGANLSFVDRLDAFPAQPEAKPEPDDMKPVATPAQPREVAETAVPPQVVDLIGGGGWTRTSDLRIMRASNAVDNKENQQLSAAESGKEQPNWHPPRNQE